MHKNNQDELALREFYSIVLAKDLPFVDQVSVLLEHGCHYLGLSCGIISYVEGERYTVLHVYDASGEYSILSGDVFDLGITYCKFTLEQQKPVGFHHAAETDIAHHPSYAALQLEAYLGAPTYQNGELFGTANFTSAAARVQPFTESEEYYIQLLAEWFSVQLDKQFEKPSVLHTYQDVSNRLHNSPHVMITLSDDYRVLEWPQAAANMFGWQAAQVLGKPPAEWPCVDRTDLDNLVRSLEKIHAAEDNACAFYMRLNKNNTEKISTEWFLSSDADSQNHTVIHAHILDISQHARAENELLRKSARYLDLYENAPDMYLSLDQAGNIISANSQCYQTLGYSEQSLLGKPFWNLILKSDVRRIRRLIDVAFKGDVQELEMEASVLTRESIVLRVHQKISIIQAKRGMPRELRIIARDITERKRGQATRLLHLQQQRDEISHEVQHRIKNSLQAVIGLLTMNMDVNPELKPILTTSIAQVNTISVVNGLILDGKEDVDIVTLLESLVTASEKLFNYRCEHEIQRFTESTIMLVGEEVIAVSLIYSELLINAFKHHGENKAGQHYIALKIDLYEDKVDIDITNTRNVLVNNGIGSTQFGQSMIHSLMPPQGASIEVTEQQDIYQVTLSLMEPTVNFL